MVIISDDEYAELLDIKSKFIKLQLEFQSFKDIRYSATKRYLQTDKGKLKLAEAKQRYYLKKKAEKLTPSTSPSTPTSP